MMCSLNHPLLLYFVTMLSRISVIVRASIVDVHSISSYSLHIKQLLSEDYYNAFHVTFMLSFQYIQMCQITGQFTDAIERCEELERRAEDGQSTTFCVYILHAESLLRLAQISPYSQQPELINCFFSIIEKAFIHASHFSLTYKLTADALILTSKFNSEIRKLLTFPPCWKITSKIDMLDVAIRCYCAVVKNKSDCPASWNDLGVAILKKCEAEKKFSALAELVITSFQNDCCSKEKQEYVSAE